MFPKFYTIFNYTSLALVAVFFILILTDAVPKDTYKPLLYITIAILLLRVGLRVYLHSYLKRSKGE